jgi:hypothetical protein
MKKFKIEGEITHYYEFEIEAEDEEHAEELGYEAIYDEDPYQQDVMELSVVEIEQEPVLNRYSVCIDTKRHYGWFIEAENEEEAGAEELACELSIRDLLGMNDKESDFEYDVMVGSFEKV